MKYNYLFLSILSLLFSQCNNEGKVENDIPNETNDSEHNMDFAKMRADYVAQYGEYDVLDTLLIDPIGDSIYLKYKYYCSFDSAITIPEKYIWEDEKKEFLTHNYLTNYLIIVNSDTVFNRNISKDDFVNVLFQEWVEYAVLFSHNFRGFDIEKNALEFGYSITIPITDLGQGKTLFIKKDGTIEIE